ncbi:MAG: FprA family A-type flavoprotein [Clostridium sp.]|uniref:FprA family A-type flavoprotein n=1 Tax=Clostridium sp. TaxID=1506 RepID=UPI003EE6B062
MECVRKVTEDLYWVGGNDRRLELFENIHPIERGVSYNSYLLLDEKTVLFDTVDWSVCRQFLENIEYALDGRRLDYLIINHIEPDHGASLEEILLRYPDVVVISSEKAFMMMRQFNFPVKDNAIVVKEGDMQCFGKHKITFMAAPMVHWPEVMVSFDVTDGVLFSADAFGSFGALDGKIFNDEVNFDRDWLDDTRRYYTNIIGKYGLYVQKLLKKVSDVDVKIICPLHGLVWRSNLGYILDKYNKWSSYEPEEKGILVVYASMYGNTENAVNVLSTKLAEKGMTNVFVYDVSKASMSNLISESFRFSHIILASVTYNLGIFPLMKNFLMDMKALNLQKRTVGIIENGSWAPRAGSKMRKIFDTMKDMTILNEQVTIVSSLNEVTENKLDQFVDDILKTMED